MSHHHGHNWFSHIGIPEYVVVADPVQDIQTFSSRIYATNALLGGDQMGLFLLVSPTIECIDEYINATQGNNIQERLELAEVGNMSICWIC